MKLLMEMPVYHTQLVCSVIIYTSSKTYRFGGSTRRRLFLSLFSSLHIRFTIDANAIVCRRVRAFGRQQLVDGRLDRGRVGTFVGLERFHRVSVFGNGGGQLLQVSIGSIIIIRRRRHECNGYTRKEGYQVHGLREQWLWCALWL